MLLNAKKLSFLGLLLACSVLLVILGDMIEFNTLFFLAAASFCTGIAIRESGLRGGLGFYIASVLLSLLLAPNKLYCLTFGAMGLYIVLIEYMYHKLTFVKWNTGTRKKFFWLIKFICFNVMFIPILLLLPESIYQGNISRKIFIIFIFGGQAAWFIFDKAYTYFQAYVWERIRKKLRLLDSQE